MLDKDIITQLKGIFANLETAFTFVVSGVSSREETRQMVEFVNDFASSSAAFSVKEEDTPTEENARPLLYGEMAIPRECRSAAYLTGMSSRRLSLRC